MHRPTPCGTAILLLRNSLRRRFFFWRSITLVSLLLALAVLGVSLAQAQLSPAPDGGYNNVAIGWRALYNNTTGSDNIGIGESALFSNTIGVYNTAVGEGSLAYN